MKKSIGVAAIGLGLMFAAGCSQAAPPANGPATSAPVVMDGPAEGMGGAQLPQPAPIVMDGPAEGMGGAEVPTSDPVVMDGPAAGMGG